MHSEMFLEAKTNEKAKNCTSKQEFSVLVLKTLIRKQWTHLMINNILVLQVLKFSYFCTLQTFSAIATTSTISFLTEGGDSSCSFNLLSISAILFSSQ